MPNSISDFCTQIQNHVGASGAVFRTSLNPDGSVQILRAPSATSGVWSVIYPRVVYNIPADVIEAGDGAGQATSAAGPFIAGLN
jgi:hypothetical protein